MLRVKASFVAHGNGTKLPLTWINSSGQGTGPPSTFREWVRQFGVIGVLPSPRSTRSGPSSLQVDCAVVAATCTRARILEGNRDEAGPGG